MICLLSAETVKRTIEYLQRVQSNQYQAGDPFDNELFKLIEELQRELADSV